MKARNLFFIFCLVGIAPLIAQITIKGKVLDKKDQPLEGASVYLNNTSVGTTTNQEGFFELSIKNGTYDLIVSFIGFETIQYTLNSENRNKLLVFKMVESANMLDEVVISKKRKKMSVEDRAYFMGQFKRNFLGVTNLSKECEILNEDVIDFDFNVLSKTLTASVSKPIKIKHKGLGYIITYDLIHFQQGPQTISYLGYTRYQNLEGSKRKKRKWNKKRRIAYNGSSMHFFRSVITNNYKDEGFIVDQFKKIPNPERPHDSIIKQAREYINNLISPNGSKVFNFTVGQININADNSKKSKTHTSTSQADFNQKKDSALSILKKSRLKKFINIDIKKDLSRKDFIFQKDNFDYLRFPHFLKIKFTKEPEEDNFRPGKAKLNHQISVISLYVKSSLIDKTGVLASPLDILLTGYWSYEKLADTLPLDYTPSE